MYTVIDEYKLVQNINTEYYKLINFYSNIKRSSVFIKYYNLDMIDSPKKPDTDETYDFYTKTRNKWDVYDLTPTQIISAIQNSPEINPDLKGQQIISATTILVYTLDNPRIGDLVVMYKPVESNEVLRVTNVRLQLNSRYSSEPIKWFELDLESAPIKYENLDKLLVNNHYVYDLTLERNIEYQKYQEYIKKLNRIKDLLNYFKGFYVSSLDLYQINCKTYMETNELIFYIKKEFDNKYHRLFEDIYAPWGYYDKYPMKYNGIEEINDEFNFEYICGKDLKNHSINRTANGMPEVEQRYLNNTVELLKATKDLMCHKLI